MSTPSAGEARAVIARRAPAPALLLSFLSCALATAAPAGVSAAEAAETAEVDSPAEASYDTAEVQRLSDEASRAYKDLDFKKARARLEKALALAREGEPQSNPVVARLRLYLGMILFTGFQSADAATAQFRVARRLDANITPPVGLFNPEVQALFDRTAAGKGKETSPTTSPAPTATQPPAPGTGDATDVTVSAPASPVAPRAPDADTSGAEASKLSPGAGQSIDDEAAAVAETPPPPTVQESMPTAPRVARRPPARVAADVEQDDDDDERAVERPVVIALSLGSGAGAATGPLDAPGISPNRAPGRFGLAGGGQVTLGVGYFVSRSTLLALEGRLQLVTGSSAHCAGDACDATPAFAAAGFARATYFLGDSGLRPFGSLGLGGGVIRQSVKLPGLSDCGGMQNQACATTVAGGPLLGSVGAGLAYDGGVVMGMVGLTANAGVPHLMVDIDLSIGVGVRF